MNENKQLENINRSEVATQLDISIDTLKETITNPCDIHSVTERMYEEALNNLINSLKEFDENASDNMLRAFAITFFDLFFTKEYDVRTLTYNIICTPQWKDTNKIDTNSKEFKLLTDYSMESDMK